MSKNPVGFDIRLWMNLEAHWLNKSPCRKSKSTMLQYKSKSIGGPVPTMWNTTGYWSPPWCWSINQHPLSTICQPFLNLGADLFIYTMCLDLLYESWVGCLKVEVDDIKRHTLAHIFCHFVQKQKRFDKQVLPHKKQCWLCFISLKLPRWLTILLRSIISNTLQATHVRLTGL